MELKSIFRALRPRQWLKNILVSLAFLMSNLEVDFTNLTRLGLGFLVFCCASSLGYLLNDWLDKDTDKFHPKKSQREFAAGKLNFRDLCIIFATVSTLMIVLSWRLNSSFKVCVLIYLLVTFSYSLWIKKIPVLEMLWLPLGFLVRAVSGALLFFIPATGWFLIVTFFGSLFIVATKRYAELSKNNEIPHRGVLDSYSSDFLLSLSTIALSVTLSIYGLWAFQVSKHSVFAMVSMFPIVLAFIQYLWHRDKGDVEAPEELLVRDWVFIVCGVSTGALVLLAVR